MYHWSGIQSGHAYNHMSIITYMSSVRRVQSIIVHNNSLSILIMSANTHCQL